MSAPDVAGARVLLLIPAQTYRASDFLAAAHRMGLTVVVGSDGALPLGGRPVLHADPRDPERSAARLVSRAGPVDAVDAVAKAAAGTGFPCVVKAVSLSGSRGVLRADDEAGAVAAAARIRGVLARVGRPAREPLIIEEYVPGPEVSVDGLLTNGSLAVTA